MSSVKGAALSLASGLNSTRRLSAASGVVLLLVLGLIPEGNVADRIALAALATLGFAAANGWLQFLVEGRKSERVVTQIKSQGSRAWLLVATAVVIIAGTSAQTWFRSGTTLAGGDDVVPNGTAWISRLWEPWIWGGSTLGEPSQLPLALPRAAILGLTQALGGDPGIAHRILESTLFIGAGLGALGLLASLRLGPVPALAGTTAYLFNPYVVTYVSPHDVYLAAFLLLPAIPAVLVAAGIGRLSVGLSAMLIAGASPLLGYAFFEPPLVGMLLAAMLSAPVLVAWVEGKDAGARSVRVLLLAIPLLLAASAYWTIPAIIRLLEAHLNSSGILLGFNWIAGELRTTIRNAFWLNTRWLWIAPEYFPYASAYDGQPLSTLRFVLPALAFSALGLARGRRGNSDRDRALRLAVMVVTAALFLVFLSTGTKAPGSIIFDRLYNLPFGWLLQEPERFIMVVALVYGILIAIVVQALLDHQPIVVFVTSRRIAVPNLRLSIAPLAVGISLVVGFPLYTGALVPDTGPPLPIWANNARPQHVSEPAYWPEMAQFTDSLPIQGAVLVMPPDDFYEMPYTWYYGADTFIAELFNRRVLVPSYPPSELVNTVNLTGQSILRRDWLQTEALVAALNAPLILVRKDIVSPYPNHSILSPSDLATALEAAPNFVRLRQIGPLELFASTQTLSETEFSSRFMTINTQTPDLGLLLPVLPPNTQLVSGEPRAGVPSVVEAPRLEEWQAKGNDLIWQPPAPAGFAYRIAELHGRTVVPLDRAGSFTATGPEARIVYSPDATNNPITVSMTGRSAISNGDFANGLWGPISDCSSPPTQANPYLDARVMLGAAPGGLPALQLSASTDNACEGQVLHWRGGPLVLDVMVNHIEGAAPALCLWETGPNRCASLSPIPRTEGWSTYRASVSPDAGTTAVTLLLYADAKQTGSSTINQYANVRAIEVPAQSAFVLLSAPDPQPMASIELVVVHSSFSAGWQGPTNSQHVLVDGMLNGWVIAAGSRPFTATYTPGIAFTAAEWISITAYSLMLLLLVWRLGIRLRGRPLGRWQPTRKAGETQNG